jgi:hypothetical protein
VVSLVVQGTDQYCKATWCNFLPNDQETTVVYSDIYIVTSTFRQNRFAPAIQFSAVQKLRFNIMEMSTEHVCRSTPDFWGRSRGEAALSWLARYGQFRTSWLKSNQCGNKPRMIEIKKKVRVMPCEASASPQVYLLSALSADQRTSDISNPHIRLQRQ